MDQSHDNIQEIEREAGRLGRGIFVYVSSYDISDLLKSTDQQYHQSCSLFNKPYEVPRMFFAPFNMDIFVKGILRM